MRLLAAFSTLVVAGLLTAAEAIRPPDSATGVINGRIALMFWPAADTTAGKVTTFLPVDDCRVILAPWTDFTAERSYGCGEWFQPAEGRYQAWLEMGSDRVSPTAATINYGAERFEGRGQLIVMPAGAGGRVTLAPDVPLAAGQEVSLINFDSCCRVTIAVPFTRRLADVAALHGGVMMPAGHVFTGVFDQRTRDAVAIARPVVIDAGKAVTAAPRPPAAGLSDVFASLGRPRIRRAREEDVVELTLGGKKPDMLFDGDDRIYAAWFGVRSGTASFTAVSKTLRLQARTLTLGSGRVTTIREELKTLPSVRVSLLSPKYAFGDEPLNVDVMPPSSIQSIRTAAVRAGEETVLESLPAGPLDVVLRVGPWRFHQSVDLTAGADQNVIFDPHPITVSGEVFYGRERAAHAEVAFEADDGFVKSTADGDGRYRLTLWHGDDAWTAHVSIPERPGPPFVDGFLQINESRTLDFRVPRTSYRVYVVDAVSGHGIAGAHVGATNIFRRNPEEGEMTLLQQAVSDDSGLADLAPLREGMIDIQAQADGYTDSGKVHGTVDGAESSSSFEVRLQPVGETVAVRLRMSDGRPAGLAELHAVSAPDGIQRPLWMGRSDERGVVQVPRSVDGSLLLIRSPQAASAIRRFDATAAEGIVLEPAGAPIRVSAPSRTRFALWIDGVRVTGPAVTFLTWSSEASDAEGTWWAKNLPARPLRVLAWRRTPVQEIAAGLRDANATTIPYPWPSTVTLNPFD
jgi:hypothetical protein